MNLSKRIAALAEAVERERLMEETEIDGLSLSLYQLEDRMASMTEADIEAMAQWVDEGGQQMLTLEETRTFVNYWKQMKQERSPRAQRWIDRALAAKGGG